MATLRSVLEVLKWASCSDLCSELSHVSSLWRKAESSDEVWDALCEAYGYDSVHYGGTMKASFFRQLQRVIYMPVVGGIKGYDVCKREWKPVLPVNLEIPFSRESSLVIFQPYIVLTGTNQPRTGQSALIHILTGEVTLLPNMLSARSCHGSLLFRGTVYVFAGLNEEGINSNTAEKLCLNRRERWVALPKMMCELAYSSPCRKGTIAYLFGGWGTSLCQSFDLIRETFSLLPFRTPQFGYLTTAFLYNNEIYFLQSGRMGRWQGSKNSRLLVTPFHDVTNSNW
jgi:hypothetical protein